MPDVIDGLLGWYDRGIAGPDAQQGVLSETNVDLVRQIFHACRDLTESTARPFSPDGHLVGSIGEVLAAQMLGLTLERPSTRGYDATDPAHDHQRVEIKATTRNTVSLSASPPEAERLVVLRLDADGAASIVYDGPYQPVWDAAGKPQKNGQRKISLGRLNEL